MIATNLYYSKVLNHVESAETAPELYMEHFPESFGAFLVYHIFLRGAECETNPLIVDVDIDLNICIKAADLFHHHRPSL